jgi:hypothetical protein
MTVEELIEQLSELVEGGEVPPDADVRLAVQPGWPFEHSVARVAVPEGSEGDDPEAGQVVYIGEGEQLGYLRSTARDALGWS